MTNYLQAADTQSTLDAVHRARRRLRDGARRATSSSTAGPARARGAARDRRRQRRHAAAAPARLARGPAGGGSVALDGDESIRRRPVDRVAAPLALMGARSTPATAASRRSPSPRAPHRHRYVLPVASAQIKSCVLLAGLLADGGDHRGRARAQPRPHRAAARRAGAAVGATATASRSSRTSSASTRSTSPATLPPRPSTPPRPCSCPAPRCASRAWRPTGPASASSASSSGWARLAASSRPATAAPDAEPLAELEVAHGPLPAPASPPTRSRWRSTSCRSWPCWAASPRARRSSRARRAARQGVRPDRDRRRRARALGGDLEATEDGFVVRGTGGLRGGTLHAHGDHRLAMLGAVAGLAAATASRSSGWRPRRSRTPASTADLAAPAG